MSDTPQYLNIFNYPSCFEQPHFLSSCLPPVLLFSYLFISWFRYVFSFVSFLFTFIIFLVSYFLCCFGVFLSSTAHFPIIRHYCLCFNYNSKTITLFLNVYVTVWVRKKIKVISNAGMRVFSMLWCQQFFRLYVEQSSSVCCVNLF